MILALSLVLIFAACTAAGPTEGDSIDTQEPFEVPFEQQDTSQELPEVVAEINGEQILAQELVAMSQQLSAQGFEVDVNQALDQIITYRVLLLEANERGFEASNQDVEDMFLAQGLQLEEVKEIVESQGTTYEQFIEEQRQDAKLNLLIREITESIVITDEQAKEFFEQQAVLMGTNATYEESEGAIKELLSNQQVNMQLEQLANQRIEQTDIQVYI